jgi:hypothetical protein
VAFWEQHEYPLGILATLNGSKGMQKSLLGELPGTAKLAAVPFPCNRTNLPPQAELSSRENGPGCVLRASDCRITLDIRRQRRGAHVSDKLFSISAIRLSPTDGLMIDKGFIGTQGLDGARVMNSLGTNVIQRKTRKT